MSRLEDWLAFVKNQEGASSEEAPSTSEAKPTLGEEVQQAVAAADESLPEEPPEEEYVSPENKPPPDEPDNQPNEAELRETFLTELASRAYGTMENASEVYRQQARLAHQMQGDAIALNLLTSVFGRKARLLAQAVDRQPEWFDYTPEGEPIVNSTPQELAVLFEMQRLPVPKYEQLYAWWRRERPTAQLWLIREMVGALLRRRRTRPSRGLKIEDALIRRVDGHLEVYADKMPNENLNGLYTAILAKQETEAEIMATGKEEDASAEGS